MSRSVEVNLSSLTGGQIRMAGSSWSRLSEKRTVTLWPKQRRKPKQIFRCIVFETANVTFDTRAEAGSYSDAGYYKRVCGREARTGGRGTMRVGRLYSRGPCFECGSS